MPDIISQAMRCGLRVSRLDRVITTTQFKAGRSASMGRSETSMYRRRSAALLAMSFGAAFAPPAPHLGVPANPARIAAWDLLPGRDGSNLPIGSGSVNEGRTLFAARCAMCHGDVGEGKPADRLTGGIGSLTSPHPLRSVASYWPYATSLFGYIRVAMPINQPRSLTAHEAYALCAYILSVDKIVANDAVLDEKTLAKIRMPNRNGFRSVWRLRR
jgi:S-disulfanyl-L-cysteine oxidoreductase SoxD